MKKKLLYVCFLLAICLNAHQTYAKMSPNSNALYNSALAHEQEGNYQRALDYIQKAIQYSPDDIVLNIKLAGLLANLGKYQEAISAYNKAISLRSEDGFLYISLGNLYMQQYDYKNALACYEKAQNLMADYKYNHINIANAKSLLGDLKGSISSYENFLEAYPNNLEGQNAIANIYLEDKDYQKAIEYFALALRTHPKDFRDYSRYGVALMKNNDFEKAEIALKSAVGINPNDALSFANLGIVQMKQEDVNNALLSFKKALDLDADLNSIRFDYAKLLELKGQTGKAIEQYEIFVENYPNYIEGYINLSHLYSKTQNIDEANDILNLGLKHNPNNKYLKLELAKNYQNNKDYNDALKYYSDVLAQDKNNPIALYNLALINTATGKFNSANSIYLSLLKIDETILSQNNINILDIKKDLFENQILQGQDYLKTAQPKKAREIFQSLLEKTQDDYRVYLGLADSSFALNMVTYAKNYYELALQIDNSNTEVLNRYAQVLYQLKETEGAIAVLNKIVEHDSKNDNAFYNLSIINFENKDYENSIKNIKKAIEIKPDELDYYNILAQIYEQNNDLQNAILIYEKLIDYTSDEKIKSNLQNKVKKLYDNVVDKK